MMFNQRIKFLFYNTITIIIEILHEIYFVSLDKNYKLRISDHNFQKIEYLLMWLIVYFEIVINLYIYIFNNLLHLNKNIRKNKVLLMEVINIKNSYNFLNE